jgi:hypothetical protein
MLALAIALFALVLALSGCTSPSHFTDYCRAETLNSMQSWNPNRDVYNPPAQADKLWFVTAGSRQRSCERSLADLVNGGRTAEQAVALRNEALRYVVP